jgi:hypothetical protein
MQSGGADRGAVNVAAKTNESRHENVLTKSWFSRPGYFSCRSDLIGRSQAVVVSLRAKSSLTERSREVLPHGGASVWPSARVAALSRSSSG